MSQIPTSTKGSAPIFTFNVVCDNKSEMQSRSRQFDLSHPLTADRERLERILDVMYAKIQKTLFPWRNPERRPRPETSQFNGAGSVERILDGTGVSADDVLSEASLGLLGYPPERLESTWEALAVRISEYKAIDALRASEKGLRGTDHRPELHLVSGDLEREGPDGEIEPSIFVGIPSDWGNPEAEYFELEAALKLRNLARELLDKRQQRIFFAIHFDDYTRREVGEQLGLTSQRVGQIYGASLLTLETHLDYPFKPPIRVRPVTERRS